MGCVATRGEEILAVAVNCGLVDDVKSDIHAEVSIIGKCARAGVSTEGISLYITMPPCKKCWCSIVAAGVSRVYYRVKNLDNEVLQQAETLGIGMAEVPDTEARNERRKKLVLAYQKREGIVPLSVPLKRADFDVAMASGKLRVCLIGMSNCGKSFRSSQLRDQFGFSKVSVDEAIEADLGTELTSLGFSGIDGMATWMGQPYDERFAANQAKYLECEEKLTMDVNFPRGQNAVLDTTGSVIALANPAKLRERYIVVHLEASEDMMTDMIAQYFACPKPVSWGNVFNQRPGEGNDEALRRCYPELLKTRLERYKALAHVNIPARVSLSREVDGDGFVQALRSLLQE